MFSSRVPMTGSANTSWPTGTVGWFYFYHCGGLAPFHALLILGGASQALSAASSDTGMGIFASFFEHLGDQSFSMFILQQWATAIVTRVIDGNFEDASPEWRVVLFRRSLIPTLLV